MIKTETITYHDAQGNAFEGTISWDDATAQKRPGVLVAHAYGGQGEFDNQKAAALAAMGYVGFAIDYYGKGVRAADKTEAQALMDGLNQNRPLLLKRMQLALEVLKNHALVDENRTGGIGFCFGGKAVLDLARSGADVLGVASFHGVYDAPADTPSTPIKASVLVLHGWEDPLATPEQTVALANELTARQADWQILAFGNTGHAFTNPKANQAGMFYQADADRRAWDAMQRLFEELF
jgi:dienelactone hydrolase